MKFNIDRGIISKILETKDISHLIESQIKPSFFSGDSRNAYQFIFDTVRSTGEVPTVRVFKKKFPNYKLDYKEVDGEEVVGVEENFKFLIDEIRNKTKHNYLANTAEELVELLSELETEEAYKVLKSTISYIEGEVIETKDIDITKNTENRKEAYLEKKKTKGMIGIPTGFKHLDYLLKGLAPKTLTTIIARTGVGKRLADYTPVLTTEGFKPISDLIIGDTIYDERGLETVITDIHKGVEQIHRVHFKDGTFVDCCKEHLWKYKTVDDLTRNNDWRTDTLENIMKHPMKKGKAFNLCIPINYPIEHTEKVLNLDPYILGFIVTSRHSIVGNNLLVQNNSENIEILNKKISEKFKGFFCKRSKGNYIYNGSEELINLLQEFKPENFLILTFKNAQNYLLGSIEQREKLLRGIIDSCGFIRVDGNTDIRLRSLDLSNFVTDLVRSLGIRCKKPKEVYCSKSGKFRFIELKLITKDFLGTRDTEKHYRHLSSRVEYKSEQYYSNLKITKIEVLEDKVPMRCLTVDSPYHTFITKDYIVTHNTWFQVLIGANCMLANCKVLQIVTEMSEEVMRDRYEAILFALCYKGFNYNHFKSGRLSSKQEKDFFEFLENDLPKLEPLILATANGVMNIDALVEKYNPDVVLIDSAYLMEDDQGAKDDWLRYTHITRDIKKLAKRTEKPFCINTQADEVTSKKSGPKLSDIKYTQAVGQDSDNVIALERDEIMINEQEACLIILKQREGDLGKVNLNWDFEHMDFSEIYFDKEDSNSNEDDKEFKDNTIGVD